MSEQKETLDHRSSLTYMDQGQWVQIQRTTFTNWVNEQLRPLGVVVQELRTDFTDGVNLVTLVEALTGHPVSGAVRKPSNQYQKLQNITVALEAVAKDGVKIINIGKCVRTVCVRLLFSYSFIFFFFFSSFIDQ